LVLGTAAIVLKLEADNDASAPDSANIRRRAAIGLGVAAAGCAGAAIYLHVRDRRKARPATTALTPLASPQLAGLAITGSW
jgi:hypothetical protein